MRRRALLTTGGTLLVAGCTVGPGRSPTATPTPAAFDGFDDADRVVVASGGGDPAVRLAPDRETFRIDASDDAVETLALTLSNHSGGRVSVAPEAWRLYRATSEGWEPQHVPEHDGPTTVLDADQAFRWVLAPQSHPSPNEPRRRDVIAALDPGRYAFAVTVDAGGRTVECVARFDVAVS